MSSRVPEERRRRRPTRSGVLLSEDLIVQTALRLIGEHGPEALSVRRLGAALGCDPTALYRYFHDTDDLVLAIADRIIGDAMAGFVPGEDWVASLREMALRVRAGYLAHPRAAAMAAHRVTRRRSEIQAVDTGIGLLLSAGFERAAAARLYLAFIDTVLSHAATDAAFQALPGNSARPTSGRGGTSTRTWTRRRTRRSPRYGASCRAWRTVRSRRRWTCCWRRWRRARLRAERPQGVRHPDEFFRTFRGATVGWRDRTVATPRSHISPQGDSMRHRRLGVRVTVAALALALLGLGSGPALAHSAKRTSPQYTAVDLGTLGGSYSSGFALDPDTVVGSSAIAGDFEWHAFAYDRSARAMTDLGTLGGRRAPRSASRAAM